MLLKSMRKSKNRYFYHIFVSPGDAPGAIMLNVVWMKENSMLTNCLAACVHLTIIVSEIERYIDRKSSIFSYPLAFDAPDMGVLVGVAPPRWYGKTRMAWLLHGEKNFEDIFIRFGAIDERDRQTDGQTDGHRVPAIAALCIASHGKNQNVSLSVK